MIPSVIKDSIDVKLIVLVKVSITPFQHLMVRHNVFESFVAYLGSKLEEWLQTISRGSLDFFDCYDLSTDLGAVVAWVIYECSA